MFSVILMFFMAIGGGLVMGMAIGNDEISIPDMPVKYAVCIGVYVILLILVAINGGWLFSLICVILGMASYILGNRMASGNDDRDSTDFRTPVTMMIRNGDDSQ